MLDLWPVPSTVDVTTINSTPSANRKSKMSYLVTLDDATSKDLEVLAVKTGLPPPKLIERVVMGYLDFIVRNPDGPGTPEVTQDPKVTPERSLYRWDEDKGTITFSPSHRRVLITSAHAWDAVEQTLHLSLPMGAAPLLMQMGEAYGRMLATDYGPVTSDPENVASYFEHLSLAAGWGKFSVAGDLKNGSKITVRVEDCVFCGSRNSSTGRKDPCHYLMGVCKGIVDTVLGGTHYVYEDKCCAKGNSFCEIVMGREDNKESKKNGWAYSNASL